jgi:hypothetical protein
LLCFCLGSHTNNYDIQFTCREVICRVSRCTDFRLCEDTASIAAFPVRSAAVTGKGKQLGAVKFMYLYCRRFYIFVCLPWDQMHSAKLRNRSVLVLGIRGSSTCMFTQRFSVSGLVILNLLNISTRRNHTE